MSFNGKYILFAQVADDCEALLQKAEEKYNTGKFDETIELITKCLDSTDIGPDSKMKAYRLLGLTYLAKDYLVEAKIAINKLLELVPNYQTDPVQDPPPYINLVEELRGQVIIADDDHSKKPEEKSNSLWYYIGGGVAAVVLGIVLLGGSSEDKGNETQPVLPDPPEFQKK